MPVVRASRVQLSGNNTAGRLAGVAVDNNPAQVNDYRSASVRTLAVVQVVLLVPVVPPLVPE
jgi:hypothetical protein